MESKRRTISPLLLSTVEAGFPSPAGDYMESPLDLNERLIPRPASTFFIRVRGQSMNGACINNDDLLVVDRSLEPQNDDIVIAELDGELTVKRLKRTAQSTHLEAANAGYRILSFNGEQGVVIWGVVTHVIHKTR